MEPQQPGNNQRNNANYNSVAKDGSVIQKSQLQRKYNHASDFGITGPYKKKNAALYEKAILDHINDPNVEVIYGSYRREPVRHYLNENGLFVMVNESTNNYWSGWQLDDKQKNDLLTQGFFQ